MKAKFIDSKKVSEIESRQVQGDITERGSFLLKC